MVKHSTAESGPFIRNLFVNFSVEAKVAVHLERTLKIGPQTPGIKASTRLQNTPSEPRKSFKLLFDDTITILD